MSDTDKLRTMLLQLEIKLEEAILDRLIWFRDELLRWNRKVNLTAITDPNEALEKHLVDSLSLLPYLNNRSRMLDMGSGGGFPAIPLKIACPGLEILSVDAVGKKVAFQNHVARKLNLKKFKALHARLEKLQDDEAYRDYDYVVARAFADLGTIIGLAEPLLAKEGQIIAMKGGEGHQELKEKEKELAAAGLTCSRLVPLILPCSAAKRTLLFITRKT